MITKWCTDKEVMLTEIVSKVELSEMEMPTLNLFVCMVWFQKLYQKKQIILKTNEYVHTG